MSDFEDRLNFLFMKYANFPVFQEEWKTTVCEAISLPQINKWFSQARLLPKPISSTETGLVYMNFNKYHLNFKEFKEFVRLLSESKNIECDEMEEALIRADIPLIGPHIL